jgi:hypothetical protein
VAFLAQAADVKAVETEKKPEQAKEQKLAKEKVPAAVMTAFRKAYPKADIKGAEQETEDSVTFIEIESTDGSVKRSVKYTMDGKVVEVEEQIEAKTLPEAARQTIAKEYPKGTVEKAERITQGDKIHYEAIVGVGEVRTELVFDVSGKTIETEVDKGDQDQE